MHVRNNFEKKESSLKGSYTPSHAFFSLLLLSVLFLLILPSPAASAPLSSETRDPLTTHFSAAAQDFTPKNASKATITRIVVLDGEDLYVQSGDYHTFYQGYRLHVKGASTEGKRVWLELSLGNESLEDLIVTEGGGLVYTKNSNEILNLTVDTIYTGTDGVLVRFSPVYQYLDSQLPRPVESEDSKPMYPLDPSQPLESENNRTEEFDSSLSLIVFLVAVLLMGLFTGISRKKLK